jgi:hypothetical protein
MYELHVGHFGCLPGDTYSLISTYKIMEGTREECWNEYDRRDGADSEIYLVKKPSMSCCSRGYLTFWDER